MRLLRAQISIIQKISIATLHKKLMPKLSLVEAKNFSYCNCPSEEFLNNAQFHWLISMELDDVIYPSGDYIQTHTGNKVSRQSVLCGSQNIVLNGKNIVEAETIIRGDLANIRTGHYCIIKRKAVLRPPFKKFAKGVAFFPLHIGEHTFIGEGSVINAASVGSYVHIGKDCVIGRRCLLKDCCLIADGTVLAPETVVPAFCIYAGSPGRCVGTLPEATQDIMMEYTKSYYQHFVPDKELPSSPFRAARGSS